MWRSTCPSILRNESDCSSPWTPDTPVVCSSDVAVAVLPVMATLLASGAKVMLQFVAEDRELGTGQQERFSPKLETTLGPVFIV